ncbi:MAG: hypothetical protein ACE5D6_04630 [Candidatus Zixiibacteriota bacterium]
MAKMIEGNAVRYNSEDNYRRYYDGNGGKPTLSVTTFTDIISKGDYFTQWYAKCGYKLFREYTYGMDICDIDEEALLICKLVNQYIDYRAYIGTMTHSHLMYLAQGITLPEKLAYDEDGNILEDSTDVMDTPEEVKIRVNNWQKYFMDALKPKILGVEVSVWSPTLPYSGTADLICEIDGKVWLIDYKTGNGLYLSSFVQVMMYKKLITEQICKVDKIGILHLKGEPRKRKYKIKEIKHNDALVHSVVMLFKEAHKKLFKE